MVAARRLKIVKSPRPALAIKLNEPDLGRVNAGVLAVIPRNSGERIVVQSVRSKGRRLTAIRVWEVVGDDLLPTRTGLSVDAEALSALVEALQSAMSGVQQSRSEDGAPA